MRQFQRIFTLTMLLLFSCTGELFAQNSTIDRNEINRTHKLVTYYLAQQNYDSSIYFADKYIKLSLKRNPEKYPIHGYTRKVLVYIHFNKLAEAYHLALETEKKFCTVKDDIPCGRCDEIYQKLSELMSKIHNYRKALEYLEMACSNTQSRNLHYKRALLYVSLKKEDSAYITTAEYIKIQTQKNNSHVLIGAYNQHGLIAKKIGRYDDAISAFKSAIELIDRKNIGHGLKPIIQGNLGSIYLKKGKLDKAYDYLILDSKGSLIQNEVRSYANAEILLSRIELKRNQKNKASVRLQQLYNTYQFDLLYSQNNEILELLIETLLSLGQTKDYINFSKKWLALTKFEIEIKNTAYQNLFDAFSKNSINSITKQMEFEKELLDQKIVLQQKESERQQLSSWFLIAALVTAIVIGLLLFLRFKAVQDKKSALKEAHLNLARQEQEILKLKVENESKNVQALSLELEVKQAFSIGLIKELSQFEQISEPELKNIEIYIQNELEIKSARAELQNKMGDLSSTFYTDIKIKYPALTDTDMKLAAMIAMNMSNKEIGVSKNITDASVKKAKTRLKHKLNLSFEDDLSDYLKSFLGQ